MPKIKRKHVTAVSIFFSTLFGTIFLFFFVLWAATFVRNWFNSFLASRFVSEAPVAVTQPVSEPVAVPATSSTQPTSTSPITQVKEFLFPSAPAETLVGSSFSDLFSGTGWINTDKTTLYQDRMTTAYIFPPAYEWNEISASSADFLERRSDGSLVSCIQNSCLTQIGTSLLWGNMAVSLPAELRGEKVVALSVGALQTRWLVGAVTNNGGGYTGWVFSFDGSNFKQIFGGNTSPLISQYKGVIGFGGSDSDWLAIYGGYEGKAVRVRGNVITDISRFFGIRVMNNGFEASVIRTSVGWYVWSLTDDNSKLMKLFENGTGDIQGAVDFTPELFANGLRRASFVKTAADALIAELVSTKGATHYFAFTDKGFDKSIVRTVQSLNLSHYPAEVRTAEISSVDFADQGASAAFYLSNDGETWERADLGETITFQNKSGRALFWRAQFVPDHNSYASPFFDRIEVFFQVKFL